MDQHITLSPIKDLLQSTDTAIDKNIRLKALDKFYEMGGFPVHKTETFTYVPTLDIRQESFTLLKDPNNIVSAPDSITLYNGEAFNTLGEENLKISVLTDINQIKPEIERRIQLDEDVYSLLNTAFVHNVLMIKVPEGTKYNKPVFVKILTDADDAQRIHFSKIIVQADANSEVEFKFENENLGASSSNTQVTFYAEKNAKLKAYFLNKGNENAVDLTKINVEIKAESDCQIFIGDMGGKLHRTSIEAHIWEQKAHFDINGVNVLKDSLHAHHYLRIHHHAPESTSNQLFYNVIQDKAQTSIDGTVIVDQAAQLTSSEQLIKSLLLTEEGKISTKPNLMIYADDVKCAHGSTCGALDEQEIFYLVSRGLNLHDAKKLLIEGFYQEVIHKIENEEMADYLEANLKSNFKAEEI